MKRNGSSINYRFIRLGLSVLMAVSLLALAARPALALTWESRTTADGLGGNWVWAISTDGGTIYVATQHGLSISTNGGASFSNKTTANGLGDNRVNGVYVSGSMVYAATGGAAAGGGVSISSDGGDSFTNKTNGLGSIMVRCIYVDGDHIYAGTEVGLSMAPNNFVYLPILSI